jgi:hypothetical protein
MQLFMLVINPLMVGQDISVLTVQYC